jgi:two-component system, NarL family, response regulator NreC
MSTDAIKVVIADDHEIFRDGISLMLGKSSSVQLIGQAANGRQLLDLVTELRPDVVITDITMPVMDGIEVTRQLIASEPETAVIGLSMFDEDNLIIDMLEAGARGYLLKNADKQEIIEAIQTVYRGEQYYCRHTTVKLTAMIAKSKFNPYKDKPKVEFNEREKEVIALICQECTNKEIGDKLCLSARTVEGYRLKILEKMNVKNSVGLVIYAIKNGLYAVKDN